MSGKKVAGKIIISFVIFVFTRVCLAGYFSIVSTTPTSCDFYGSVQINGAPGQPGDEVAAFDPQGVCCGVYTITTEGLYGFMPVYGDDDSTPGIDEGARPGDTITFKVWQASTNQVFDAIVLGPGTPIWSDAARININLSTSSTQLTLRVDSTYGSPSPGVGTHYYNSGSQVTASVSSPVTGPSGTRYVCTGWAGTGDVPASGEGTSVSFTITQNSTITWQWKVQYYLTTQCDPEQGGTITPASNWYDTGSVVQVQATANPGYVFSHWSGDISGSNNPTTVTMNGPRTATAVFAGEVNLTVASAYGSPSPGVGTHSYAKNTQVTVSVLSPVTAGTTRYVCTGWAGTGDVPASGEGTSVTFTITQNSTITWQWKVQYYLSTKVSPAAGGSITPASGWYDSNTIVEVSASANPNFNFTGWSGDLSGTENPTEVTMTAAKAVIANFSLVGRRYTPVALTDRVREFYGTVTINGEQAQPGDEVGAFDPQGVCCGAFVVEEGKQGLYGFMPVYGDDDTTENVDEGASAGDTITFYIWDSRQQKEYVAIASVNPVWQPMADPLQVNLSTGATLTVASTHGNPTPAAGVHLYDTQTEITASVISPVDGGEGIRYVCTGWTGTGDVPGSGTDTSVTFTITQTSTITWQWKTQYYLTIISSHGNVIGAGWYDAGTTANWSVNSPVAGTPGVQYVATPSSGNILMDGPKTITVNWVTQYYLTINSSYGTPSGAGWYDAGTTANWSVNSPVAGAEGVRYVAIPSSGSIFMDEPKTYTIPWQTQYYLTINSAHGTPSGAGWYDAGTTANWSVNSPVSGDQGIRYVTAPTSGSVQMNSPQTLTITWTTQYYFTVISDHGSPTGENWYNEGSSVGSMVISPEISGTTQYVCLGWTGTGSAPVSGSSTSVTFTITQPSSVTWLWKTQYYLTVNSVYGTPSGAGWYDAGTTANWSVNSPVSVGAGIRCEARPSSGSVLMNEAKTVEVTWITQYYLTTTVNNTYGGSISPESNWYDSGSVVSLLATASNNYTFTGWSGSLTGTANPVNITINGPAEVTANFSHFLPFTQSNRSLSLSGSVKIFTVEATYGDEIAVYDSQGVCCGSFMVTNTGCYGNLIVYGDDPNTTDVDEGAQPGEQLTFRIWKASEGKTYTAKPLGPDQAIWTENGASLTINLDVGQRIPLRAGWNLISFSVNRLYYSSDQPPNVPLLPNTEMVKVNDINDALSSIDGKYIVIRGFDSYGYHTYDPTTPDYNTLDYLAPGYGYWIKMKEEATLELLGAKLPASADLSLSTTGSPWRLVGCWASNCYYDTTNPPAVALPEDITTAIKVNNVAEVLPSLSGKYTYIRSFDASGYHTYSPGTPQFNTLHYFAPGYGYWIKLTEPANLQWVQ